MRYCKCLLAFSKLLIVRDVWLPSLRAQNSSSGPVFCIMYSCQSFCCIFNQSVCHISKEGYAIIFSFFVCSLCRADLCFFLPESVIVRAWCCVWCFANAALHCILELMRCMKIDFLFTFCSSSSNDVLSSFKSLYYLLNYKAFKMFRLLMIAWKTYEMICYASTDHSLCLVWATVL